MPHNFQDSASADERVVDDSNSNNSERFGDKNNAENPLNYKWAAGRGGVRNIIRDGALFNNRNCREFGNSQSYPASTTTRPTTNDNGRGLLMYGSSNNYLYRQRLGFGTLYSDNDKAALTPQQRSSFRNNIVICPGSDDTLNDGGHYYYGSSSSLGGRAPTCKESQRDNIIDDKDDDKKESYANTNGCPSVCKDYSHCDEDDTRSDTTTSLLFVEEAVAELELKDVNQDDLSYRECQQDGKGSDDSPATNQNGVAVGNGDAAEEPDDDSHEAPKVPKSKSYWRKQRRLRLKELLVAQRLKMEAEGMSPEEIQQERMEISKKKKSMKPKVEIDYDSYLPANILMHVKRDLVSILMEYGQTREVQVSFDEMDRTGPHHASRFFTSAVVDGETFPVGCGSSKKNAKKAAAAFALKIMYERGKQNLRMVNESAFKKIGALNPKDPESRAHKVLLASRHALEVCQETQFINYSKEKIVATFVLELHGKMKVVALGTGNRCILYPNLTKDGSKIIHAHAEIIARRAFIRYLYKQLRLFNKGRSHPIFTKSESGKLKLREKIQVHLYISRPPCGDAAAFPTIGNHPNKMRAVRKQGQLRTIIDDGEGAIPTEFHVPPGPNGKERLRIMTCSDKICRWNALGVQGALLSHFIDPIYVNTLVIGSHTGDQRGHLPRAISGRIKCGRLHEVIQRPYRINSPEIQYPHDDMCDIYAINKSKQYFITWSYGDEDTEVIDAITGVTNMEPMDEPMISRVCKRSLHSLFKELCAKFGRRDLLSMDYSTAKRCATTFQRMKSFVGQHMAVMGFGHWYSLQEAYGTDDFSSSDCPPWC